MSRSESGLNRVVNPSGGHGPDREDPTFAPFWEGTDRGELLVQQCDKGHVRWPPRPMCPTCHSTDHGWIPVNPRATLFSWTEVRHQTVRGMPAPYVLALVELSSDPTLRMLGRLLSVPEARRTIGMALTAVFEPSDLGVTLVNWTESSATA